MQYSVIQRIWFGNYKTNKFYNNVKGKLDGCFLVIKFVETSNIYIYR